MTEAVQKAILNELKAVKAKVLRIDKALNELRNDFEDTHAGKDEYALVAMTIASGSFDFLKYEPELYSEKDLIERYT